MKEMNILTLNGEQYEVADKKAREDISYISQNFAPVISETETGPVIATSMVSPVEHEIVCQVESKNVANPADAELSPDGTFLNVMLPRFYLSAGDSVTLSVSSPADGLYFYDLSDTELVHAYSATSVTFTTNVSKQIYGAVYSADGVSPSLKYQVERGKTVTPYTPYVLDLSTFTVSQTGSGVNVPRTFPVPRSGAIKGIKSIAPEMSISIDSLDVILTVTYNADTKKYIDSRIAALMAPTSQAWVDQTENGDANYMEG